MTTKDTADVAPRAAALHELHDTDDSTLDIATGLGLSAEEYDAAKRLLSRTPNKVEIGIFSAMWNEHCSKRLALQTISIILGIW